MCVWYSLFSCVCVHSAQNQSENAVKTGSRGALGNQVIRKGYMCIHNLGIMKGIRTVDASVKVCSYIMDWW